jgi:hypothetical protein
MLYQSIASEVATFQRELEKAYLEQGVVWQTILKDIVQGFMLRLIDVSGLADEIAKVYKPQETPQ